MEENKEIAIVKMMAELTRSGDKPVLLIIPDGRGGLIEGTFATEPKHVFDLLASVIGWMKKTAQEYELSNNDLLELFSSVKIASQKRRD